MAEELIKTYLTASADQLAGTPTQAARQDLLDTLTDLEGAVLPEDLTGVADQMEDFAGFAAKVALIGQVKAGKTALANALLGVSELLPSDVNPWTSVVTSIHINREAPKGKRAIFRFFDESDWDDLVSDSGRIVQLAKKAKLDTRLDELTDQIRELRDRTEARLGRNFKLLLGNHHSFSAYSADLVKRYVCLGEEGEVEEKEGRFADLTKSADLYMDTDRFDYPLTLADTPGVNDPFLVREAATLANLGDADICVVVLSAHQALSTVDLGLLRLLRSLRSKQLILFVNRVDELPDPDAQIREIRTHIGKVLKKQKLSGDIPVIFGSAAWADAAITGHTDLLPEDSIDSLRALVETRRAALPEGAMDSANIENLVDVSGISALRAAIDRKAWSEVYQPRIATVANRARRIAERSALYLGEAHKDAAIRIDPQAVEAAVTRLTNGRDKLAALLAEHHQSARDKLMMDMAGAYMAFTKKEKAKLLACLNNSGKLVEWVPGTEALRDDLNEIYSAYADKTTAFLTEINTQIAQQVALAYEAALGANEDLRITPLPVTEPPIPVALMRTMSIDLRASSSLEWLRRKLDKSIYLDQFEAIANDDLRATVDETCHRNIDGYFEQAGAEILTFLGEHAITIASFAQISESSIGAHLDEIRGAKDETAARIRVLRDAATVLHRFEGGEAVTPAQETA